MADIFISYAREDIEVAARLAAALEKQGRSVFWDRGIIVGQDFSEVIEEQLGAASCVIVLWSRAAKKSRWVRDEAEEGLRRNILAPALIEPKIGPPMGFRQIQTANLMGWQGEDTHGEFQRLLEDIAHILASPPSPVRPDPPPILRRISRKLASLIPKSRLARYEILLGGLGALLFSAYLILWVEPRPCPWKPSQVSKAAFADEYLTGKGYWSAPESWKVEKGKWLFVTGPGIGWLRERVYEDFRLIFPIKLANLKGAMWIIRSHDDKNYYMFQLLGPAGNPPNTFRTFILKNGKLQDKSTNSIVPDLSNPDDWIRIRADVKRGRISHWIEVPSQPTAKPRLMADLEENSFLCGRIGLGSKDGEEFYAGPIIVHPWSGDAEGHEGISLGLEPESMGTRYSASVWAFQGDGSAAAGPYRQIFRSSRVEDKRRRR
jgi:hypothetical protein